MKTEMKTVLVTGGAGFIGTNFIRFGAVLAWGRTTLTD